MNVLRVMGTHLGVVKIGLGDLIGDRRRSRRGQSSGNNRRRLLLLLFLLPPEPGLGLGPGVGILGHVGRDGELGERRPVPFGGHGQHLERVGSGPLPGLGAGDADGVLLVRHGLRGTRVRVCRRERMKKKDERE